MVRLPQSKLNKTILPGYNGGILLCSYEVVAVLNFIFIYIHKLMSIINLDFHNNDFVYLSQHKINILF